MQKVGCIFHFEMIFSLICLQHDSDGRTTCGCVSVFYFSCVVFFSRFSCSFPSLVLLSFVKCCAVLCCAVVRFRCIAKYVEYAYLCLPTKIILHMHRATALLYSIDESSKWNYCSVELKVNTYQVQRMNLSSALNVAVLNCCTPGFIYTHIHTFIFRCAIRFVRLFWAQVQHFMYNRCRLIGK